MEKEHIKNRLIHILIDKWGLEPHDITENSHLINDLGGDSLDMVELLMECEIEFNIEIPDDDTEKMQTVKDCVEYLHSKIK